MNRWGRTSRINRLDRRAGIDDRGISPPDAVAAAGDCSYALQPSIPNLTRSSLHRCLMRHGISRLPEVEGDKPVKKQFKRYPIGYFHIDIAEVNTDRRDDIICSSPPDRKSKFADAEPHVDQARDTACRFLRQLYEVIVKCWNMTKNV